MDGDWICVSGVGLCFKANRVLDDVSASFEKGKIHGIIGRNGSGKTVLMKIICGFLPPDTGNVSIGGEIVGVDREFPRDIGILIEAPSFLPSVSGIRNLMMIAAIRNECKKEALQGIMERVGLDPKSRKWVSKYSMGMKQRLGIAQAIMEDPDLLILDEPMNGLDNQGVSDMRSLFLELKARGKTILLASHNREDIETLCDQVYEMDAGVLTRVR
ncbi:MAG: ABC transporter ATP-binding protein [Clostridia bacterium]